MSLEKQLSQSGSLNTQRQVSAVKNESWWSYLYGPTAQRIYVGAGVAVTGIYTFPWLLGYVFGVTSVGPTANGLFACLNAKGYTMATVQSIAMGKSALATKIVGGVAGGVGALVTPVVTTNKNPSDEQLKSLEQSTDLRYPSDGQMNFLEQSTDLSQEDGNNNSIRNELTSTEQVRLQRELQQRDLLV